ncbi:MAG: hypothetical protein LBS74_11235 [Oscillospiraceae bacterium]|jgi:hypothetical protein|nr:hypothetical protein [Oscillospiraceae bacterium]
MRPIIPEHIRRAKTSLSLGIWSLCVFPGLLILAAVPWVLLGYLFDKEIITDIDVPYITLIMFYLLFIMVALFVIMLCSVLLGVFGIISSNKSKRISPQAKRPAAAKAGLVLCSISLPISAISLIAYIGYFIFEMFIQVQ